MRKGVLSIFVCLTASLLIGCVSSDTYHTARVLPDDARSFYFGASASSVKLPQSAWPLPILTAGVREGFGNSYDVGLQYTAASGLGADIKYELLVGDHFATAAGFGLHLAPGLGVLPGIFEIQVPLYGTYELSEDLAVTLSPRYLARLALNSAAENYALNHAGVMVGLRFGADKGMFISATYLGSLTLQNPDPFVQLGAAFYWNPTSGGTAALDPT